MKTVLITGSTSGIGLGIAKELAKTKKYNIVFNGLESNGKEIAENTGKELAVIVMFSDATMLNSGELKKMTEQAISQFGSIAVLVNNAGIRHVSPIDDFPDDKWNAIIGLNLSSAFP